MTSRADSATIAEIVDQVREFARRAAEQTGLPGLRLDPGDAFRHIVGTAELTRRLGALPAFAAVEFNEARSWAFAQLDAVDGGGSDPGNSRAARDMDRANNAIGVRIGLRSATPSQILLAARFEIERAAEAGQGVDGAARWLPVREWGASITAASNWPPRSWPELRDLPALRTYPGRELPSVHRPAGNEDGAPVNVRPYVRNGHPVSGHVRGNPAP